MKDLPSVSVIVPIFNNLELIKVHFKKIISELKNNDQLIIVDDQSTDGSKDFLIKQYHLVKKADGYDQDGAFEIFSSVDIEAHPQIILIVNQINLRFAASCNRGVAHANSPLVFLVNSDVILTKGVLQTLKVEFQDNPKLFAVGCLEKEPNEGGVLGGKNKLWFKNGLFQHSRASEFTTGETAWVSGGSGIFDKQKWQELGGFDKNYYPAYWEDIDLSVRAKKKGWTVKFLDKAKVIHNHQSTNCSVFKQKQLEQISWKNADYFSWKNGSLLQKILYILFRPYWWLKRAIAVDGKYYVLGFWLIILLATLLRFYKLAQVPAGMTWDEAALGYNGYAVIRTRHDEWLDRLPVSFKSFGDYKAPFAIYLVGLSTTLFGLSLYSVRLPFAVSGVLAVWGLIKLTRLILEIHYSLSTPKKQNLQLLSLASGFILATSPWHLHFTRTGFESGLALTLTIWGLYFLAKSPISHSSNSPKKYFQVDLRIIFSALLLASSLYTYHSSKIFLPVLLLTVAMIHTKMLLASIKKVIIFAISLLILLIPLIKDSLFGEGLTRSGTLIFSQASSIGELVSMIAQRLRAHLSVSFLIGGWTDVLRHGTTQHSVFLIAVFLLMVVGLLKLLANFFTKRKTNFIWLKICITLIIIGLLPAVLGDTYPQANRALFALLGFIWLALVGVEYIIFLVPKSFKNKKKGFVVGNLPYQISSPIIHNTCYESEFLDGALFLLQKEVAEKLCALPGTREFGPIAGIVKMVGRADYLFTLPPEEFYPSPKVNSALVKITFYEHGYDREHLKKFVSFMRSLFSNRRKTLLNVFKINKLDIDLLKRLEISETLRAESLDWETIVSLSKAVMEGK